MENRLEVHMKKLDEHLEKRLAEIKKAKESGSKVVGFFPGNYVPEEIIYASGAVPLCIADGGDSSLVEASLSEIPRRFCSFVRAQIGAITQKSNPYFELIDLLVAPIGCQHLKKMAEIIEFRGYMDMVKLGVPRSYESKFSLDYYTKQLEKLKDRLQQLTGNEITDEKLQEAIKLNNSKRNLLREISLLRTKDPAPIRSLDFIKLNHASYYADPSFMVEILQNILQDLKEQQPAPQKEKKPRILLVGPNLVYGDYKVPELIEEAGGEIVVEEISEGIMSYWQTISEQEAPIKSLAKGYLWDRVPCAFMVHSAKSRLDFAQKLIKDFNVSGVVWYEVLSCETYDAEAYYFSKNLEKQNIPQLTLESDYGNSDVGQLKTRIDAFMELLKGGVK